METYKVPAGFINQDTLNIEGGKVPCIISPRRDKMGLHTAFCNQAFGLLQPGDPFGTPVTGPGMWLNTHFTQPRPRDFHFGILWMRHPHRADWITLESSPPGHGIRPGLLSYHLPGRLDIYRVDTDAKIRHNAPWALNDWASQSKKEQTFTSYGFMDFPGFVASGVISWAKILFTEHRLRALKASELSRFYKLDRSIICTAAAWLSYKLCGFDFEQEMRLKKWGLNPEKYPPPQPSAVPLPCVFEEAVKVGVLEVLYHV